MYKDDEEKNDREFTMVFGLSADALRGRQSVRATFRLPQEIIGLLSLAASQLGLKQKSLFDQLVEDREVLEKVAAGAGGYTPRQEQRQQKTYVLSRNSLLALEQVAKRYGVPRDLLVEISINRLLPVINSEQERQRQRKKLLAEMEAHFSQGLELLNRSDQTLGREDAFSRHWALLMSQCQRHLEELREIVDKGREIEEFQ